MSFELQDVVNDPDLAEPFTIHRDTITYVPGGINHAYVDILAWGVVTVASDEELAMVPEADQVHGARAFYCEQQIYETNALREDGTAGTSDVLVWNNFNYRVVSVGPYQNRGGFYKAIAVRMRGN